MRFFTFILKNLLRRKVRTLLTGMGVAVAVGTVVALVGLSQGFEKSFEQLFETHGIDLMVVKKGAAERLTSSLHESIAGRIRLIPGVAAVTYGLADVVSFEDKDLIGVVVWGWPPDSFLLDDLETLSGRRINADDRLSTMLGVQLAEALGKKVGDKVEMEGAEFEVVAVYQSKNVYENGSAILPLAEMQRLMDRPNQVTAFQVALHFSPELEQRRDEVRAAIDGLRDENGRSLYLSAMPAREYAQTTIQILMFRAMAWTTSMLALIIGAIGMLNTMIMSVFEQTKQIGILRAIGWRKGRVMRMILGESLLLCLAGAAVGTLGAVGLVRWLSTLSTAAAYIRGDTPPEVIGLGFGVAVVVGLLGGLYPAYRGASLLPTEAIRHE